MNNKGFTLIELIMVIAILIMLSLFATPNVIKLLEENKLNNYNTTIESIIEAVEVYVSDNRYDLTFDPNCSPNDTNDIVATVTLQTLVYGNYITEPIKNGCTEEDISKDTKVKIILNCGTRQFSYDIDESTSSDTLRRKTDDSGNEVSGLEGLTLSSCSSLY